MKGHREWTMRLTLNPRSTSTIAFSLQPSHLVALSCKSSLPPRGESERLLSLSKAPSSFFLGQWVGIRSIWSLHHCPIRELLFTASLPSVLHPSFLLFLLPFVVFLFLSLFPPPLAFKSYPQYYYYAAQPWGLKPVDPLPGEKIWTLV